MPERRGKNLSQYEFGGREKKRQIPNSILNERIIISVKSVAGSGFPSIEWEKKKKKPLTYSIR